MFTFDLLMSERFAVLLALVLAIVHMAIYKARYKLLQKRMLLQLEEVTNRTSDKDAGLAETNHTKDTKNARN